MVFLIHPVVPTAQEESAESQEDWAAEAGPGVYPFTPEATDIVPEDAGQEPALDSQFLEVEEPWESEEATIIEAPLEVSVPVEEETAVVGEEQIMRDPFWPMGFVPEPPTPASGQDTAAVVSGGKVVRDQKPQWDEALKAVNVQGRMKTGDGSYMAVVNNRVVVANDMVAVQFGGRTYQWRIAGIGEDGVAFVRQQVTSP
ncbi:MAG: hypothetical protein KKC51_15135 [Verrucomicrobia bacterium]|nr:hypothetical protein [Verrucomicrobiota bacterium]